MRSPQFGGVDVKVEPIQVIPDLALHMGSIPTNMHGHRCHVAQGRPMQTRPRRG